MSNNQEHKQNYSTPIGIPQPVQSQMIEMLNQTLSTTTDLKIHIRQAQWNEYVNCYQPHTVFDETVALLDEYIGLFSAWLVALDGTTTNCLKTKQIALPDVKDHVTALAARLEPYAKLLREANKLPI